MPTDSALAHYYGAYYKSEVQAEGHHITFDDPIRFARHLARVYRRFQMGRRASILDFGGGDGTIANLVAAELVGESAEQADITVIDHTKRLAVSHDPRIAIRRAETLGELRGKFTFVIASAVIEHHPRPRAILGELLSLVEPGGIFYARTPCVLPLIRMAGLLGIKLDFTYPAHLHDLGQTFWDLQFSSGPYRVIRSNPSIVETTFRNHFLRTLAAYSLKMPWHLLGESYPYTGGWEVFARLVPEGCG